MTRKLDLTKPCADRSRPRIGGGALIGAVVDWPASPDRVPLTLVMSLPARFVNLHGDCQLPDHQFVSVFSDYRNDAYFLDAITYHGSPDKLALLRQGYTRVLMHRRGHEVFGPVTIPAMDMLVQERDAAAVWAGGSRIGGQASLLQAEPLEPLDGRFILQLYAGDFPHPHRDVFGLSNAAGFLFIDPMGIGDPTSLDIGSFFVQTT